MTRDDPRALRRLALAVSVLDDLDVEPGDDAVVLPGAPPVRVGLDELRAALGGRAPEQPEARRCVAALLAARRRAADLGPYALVQAVRPLGLPVGHLLHPGPDWVRERVLGGALDLGLGLDLGDAARPRDLVALPPSALGAAATEQAWADARRRLEELGRLAADLLVRGGPGVLRPVGGADVPTLLGARSLRTSLAGAQGGLAGAVVPMRTRGWTALSLVDPAFGPAAAAATEPAERGFDRPLLVTADEVAVVADGGSPALLALRQPARAAGPWGREVLRG